MEASIGIQLPLARRPAVSPASRALYRMTWVPSAGSSTFHSHGSCLFSLCCLSVAIILFAISSKLLVASARMVGPAPDRHTPRNPGCVLGDMDSTTCDRPGMSVWRYG